jgi:hypothetical protein
MNSADSGCGPGAGVHRGRPHPAPSGLITAEGAITARDFENATGPSVENPSDDNGSLGLGF